MFLERLETKESIKALSTNRDGSLVVVAGQNVLKVFSVSDDHFEEQYNLRVGRHPNLLFSAQDVVWSPVDENLIATASTNCNVVVWNLAKPHKKKLDVTFKIHERAVNKVCFHPTEAHYIISGSQDSTVKLFDLRRPEDSAITFKYGTESAIRDLQFSPLISNVFASSDDAGTIKCWDIRFTDKPYKLFQAHGEPVYSLAFHSVARHWIATGGRDRLIKVWDTNKDKPTCEYTVQTIQPVCKVRWRPECQYQIASCSLVLDFTINIWDIRRPYIPFALFEGHKDCVTGIEWSNVNCHSFLSCGKDSCLIQHSFDDAIRPADYANPMGLDFGPSGEIVCSRSTKLFSGEKQPSTLVGLVKTFGQTDKNKQNKSSNKFDAPNTSNLFFCVPNSSHLTSLDKAEHALSMEWFIDTALQYKLSGFSFSQLCEFNHAVASKLNRYVVAQSWSMLKTILTYPSMPDGSSKRIESGDSTNLEAETKPLTVDAQQRTRSTVSFGDDNPVGHLDETEEESELAQDSGKSAVIVSGPLASTADFFFGPAELNIGGPNLEGLDGLLIHDWKLEREAFEPKTELINPITNGLSSDDFTSSSGETLSQTPSSGILNYPFHDIMLKQPDVLGPLSTSLGTPIWDPSPLVAQMLTYLAEIGDIQSSVSMLVVLGSKGVDLVDPTIQEAWYLSYIDLLERFELWSVASEIIKHSSIQSVKQLSQEGTAVTLVCSHCNKSLPNGKCLCQKCSRTITNCCICQQIVRGRWIGCRYCGHGGHSLHMQDWFLYTNHKFCPAGCGHECQLET